MLHEWRSSIVKKLPPKTLIITIAACLLGVILALVEAELPADTTFFEALPFWLTITGTTAFLLTTVGTAVRRFVEEIELSRLPTTAITGTVTVILVTIPVALMCLPIDSLQPDEDSLFDTAATTAPLPTLLWGWLDQYLNLLPAIAGFWLFLKSLDFALPDPVRGVQKPDDGPTEEAGQIGDGKSSDDRRSSALERRFPEITGQALLAIEADEHYVRLHTDQGSQHVLYRFRDALKDVEDLAGLRVHRSWWVAEDAVKQLERTATGVSLKLKDGLTAPVSQTYRREVERVIEALAKAP